MEKLEKLNQDFQQLLVQNDFPMKVSFNDNQWLYQGKLEISDYHILDFAISFRKIGMLEGAICQIIFNNVGFCKSYEKRGEWLEFLNQLNVEMGLYYYLGLENDGRIFARHIMKVHHDVQMIYDLLNEGANVMVYVIEQMEEKFGPIVSF